MPSFLVMVEMYQIFIGSQLKNPVSYFPGLPRAGPICILTHKAGQACKLMTSASWMWRAGTAPPESPPSMPCSLQLGLGAMTLMQDSAGPRRAS
jgi:hypothetical protein